MYRKPMLLLALVTIALPFGTTGCTTTRVASLASHTIQVAPTQEADVIWLLKDDRLIRCTGEGTKPSCTVVGSF
jgi:hypothetical protein